MSISVFCLLLNNAFYISKILMYHSINGFKKKFTNHLPIRYYQVTYYNLAI